MDRRFHDAPHLRTVAAGGGQAPQLDDGPDDLDGPSFLPPMRRRSRSVRKPARSAQSPAGLATPVRKPEAAQPPPRPAEAPRPAPSSRHEPTFRPPVAPAPARSATAAARPAPAPAAAAAPSAAAVGMDDFALSVQEDWTEDFGRPSQLAPTHGVRALSPRRTNRAGAWLRPAFQWLARGILPLLASLLLVGGLAALWTAWQRGGAAPAAAAAAPKAVNPLRQLVGQMEECRGIESLLVMLPVGAERDATLIRLKRQQVSIEAWLRDNGPQLTARHGPHALMELRESVRAWHALQQRVAEAEVEQTRTGLPRESRQLLTGPSAEAYRQMIALVQGMVLREPT